MQANIKKIFGIVAHPAGHSLSPTMHNAGFTALGLTYECEAYDVLPEELADFMKALKAGKKIKCEAGEFDLATLEGFSVSMPHKETIIPLLDGLDEAGATVQAVSCVYKKGGKFIGTNLDHIGVAGALKESKWAKARLTRADAMKGKEMGNAQKHVLQGIEVLVVGGGGAAKAAVYGLLKAGAMVTICNRTVEKIRGIADQFASQQKIPVLTLEEAGRSPHYEIVINCTSLGLESDAKVISDEVFTHAKLALDAVYSHTTTMFQRQALSANIELLTGLDWLLNQGFEAFRLWTGSDEPKDAMKKAVHEAMQNHE